MFVSPSLYDSLFELVSDGGTVAFDELFALTMASSELGEFSAAYVAMSAWGEQGFRSIVNVAMMHGRVAPKTTAFMMLSNIAVTGNVWQGFLLNGGRSVANHVDAKLAKLPARHLAKQALSALVMDLPTDELFSPLSNATMFLSLGHEAVANELMAALSTRWFRFGPAAMAEFESLLAEHANHESAFQSFFCTHPQLLDPMAVQVWSQPDFHGGYEPDFIFRRADNSYVVVEIECPGKMLMTKAGQLSSQTLHAEKQALEYENFLSQRVMEVRHHFPGFNRAECLVVVGMESHLSDIQRQGLQMANSKRQHIRIVGFDWLLNRAKAVIANVSHGGIKVIERHRMI